VINGVPPLSGTLYLGAGGNNLNAATIVGSFTIVEITVQGSNYLVLTYDVSSPFSIQDADFYNDVTYPAHVVPGQFTYHSGTLAPGTTTYEFVVPYDPAKATYIVHADITSNGGVSCS
jgi:hypothetical protein